MKIKTNTSVKEEITLAGVYMADGIFNEDGRFDQLVFTTKTYEDGRHRQQWKLRSSSGSHEAILSKKQSHAAMEVFFIQHSIIMPKLNLAWRS